MVWYCFKCDEVKLTLPESLVRCPDCQSIKHYKNLRIEDGAGPGITPHIAATSRKRSKGRVRRWRSLMPRISFRWLDRGRPRRMQTMAPKRLSCTSANDSAHSTDMESSESTTEVPVKGCQENFASLQPVCVHVDDCESKGSQDADLESQHSVAGYLCDTEIEEVMGTLGAGTTGSAGKLTGDQGPERDAGSDGREPGEKAIKNDSIMEMEDDLHTERSSWF